MARKPNSMYREITQQAFTRRKYTGGIPPNRILSYQSGSPTTDFPIVMELVAEEQCQIRSQALEAGRVTAGRFLDKRVGRANFYFRIRVVPHHILRENKQATGAGADRVSQGMRRSFGNNVGLAARIMRDQAVFELRCAPQHLTACKDALRKCGMKLPTPVRLEFTKGIEHALG